jgi:hypothetical protein
MPEEDRSWYQANLREGRTALSVFVRDAQEHDRVAEVLEEFEPIDFDAAASTGPGPVGERRQSLGSAEAWSQSDVVSRTASGFPPSDISAGSMQSTVQPGIVGSGE